MLCARWIAPYCWLALDLQGSAPGQHSTWLKKTRTEKQSTTKQNLTMKTQQIVRRSLRWSGALLAGLAVLAMPLSTLADDIEIQCSPSVVNLNSRTGGDWMTVHTDLDFPGDADAIDATLNGLTAVNVFADDCGDLVAKFRLSELKGTLTAGTEVTLTLTVDVTYTNPDTGAETVVSYEGSDTVRVVQPPSVAPQQRARKGAASAEQQQQQQLRARQCVVE